MNFKTENSTTPNGDWSQSKAFTNSGSSFPVLNGTCELDQETLLCRIVVNLKVYLLKIQDYMVLTLPLLDITDLNNQSGYQYNNNLAHDLYFTGSMEMPTTQHPYITNTNNHLSYSNSSEEFSPIGNNMSPDSTGEQIQIILLVAIREKPVMNHFHHYRVIIMEQSLVIIIIMVQADQANPLVINQEEIIG